MTWTAPSQDPEAWRHLRVLAFDLVLTVPGIVTIDATRSIPYDEKAAAGQDGATNERKGEALKKFTSTHLLTDEPWPPGAAEVPADRPFVTDFDQWNGAELLFRESYGGDKPKALTVIHPELERQGIQDATVEEIGRFTDNGDGSGTITVKWTQYRPPTPSGGGGASGNPDKDTPDQRTAADDEIDRLIDEIDRLDKEYEAL